MLRFRTQRLFDLVKMLPTMYRSSEGTYIPGSFDLYDQIWTDLFEFVVNRFRAAIAI